MKIIEKNDMRILVAENGYIVTKIGDKVYVKAKMLLPNESIENFIDVAEIPDIENQVPEKITKLQLKIQLVRMGFDLQIIENAIDALPEPQRIIAMLAWAEATNFYRSNEMIAIVGQMFKLTSEQIDKLFIEADKIRL